MSVAGVEERFGPYGGRFVPEVLVAGLDELTAAYGDKGAETGQATSAKPTPES